MNLEIPGAIFPLCCAFLNTRAKTVWRTRVNDQFEYEEQGYFAYGQFCQTNATHKYILVDWMLPCITRSFLQIWKKKHKKEKKKEKKKNISEQTRKEQNKTNSTKFF